MTQVTIREAVISDIPQLKTLMLAYIVDFYQYRQPEDEKLNALIHELLEQKDRHSIRGGDRGGNISRLCDLIFHLQHAACLQDCRHERFVCC